MTSHTGQNLYTCQYCSRGFKRNSTLHTHRKKAHYDEWLRDRKPPRTVGTLGVAQSKESSTTTGAGAVSNTTTTTSESSPAITNTIIPMDEPSTHSTTDSNSVILDSMSPSTMSMHQQGSVGDDSSIQQQQQQHLHQQNTVHAKESIMENFSPMHMRHDNNMSPQQPLGLVMKEQPIDNNTIPMNNERQQTIDTTSHHHTTVSVIMKEQFMENSQPIQISQDSQD